MLLSQLVVMGESVAHIAKVLFIEDDVDDVFLIQRACTRAGIDATKEFLPNGRAATEYLSNDSAGTVTHAPPDLIFLDLNMPIMGGLDFLDWLRHQPLLKTIPVVVLTSSENPQDMRKAYESGANAYVVKPTSMGQLVQMLAAAQKFCLNFHRFC